MTSTQSGCLNCGKQLGNHPFLCYSCRSEGHVAKEIVSPDPDVVDKVEEFIIVSALRCSDCGSLHTTVDVEGTTYTAEDFALESEAEWQLEMDRREDWIREHSTEVREALPTLHDEWPHSVEAIQSRVL